MSKRFSVPSLRNFLRRHFRGNCAIVRWADWMRCIRVLAAEGRQQQTLSAPLCPSQSWIWTKKKENKARRGMAWRRAITTKHPWLLCLPIAIRIAREVISRKMLCTVVWSMDPPTWSAINEIHLGVVWTLFVRRKFRVQRTCGSSWHLHTGAR